MRPQHWRLSRPCSSRGRRQPRSFRRNRCPPSSRRFRRTLRPSRRRWLCRSSSTPTGGVESAVEISRVPRDAPDAFARAAIDAVKAAKFAPSSRDGRPIRSRIEYVVVFHPPADAGAAAPAPAPAPRRAAPARACVRVRACDPRLRPRPRSHPSPSTFAASRGRRRAGSATSASTARHSPPRRASRRARCSRPRPGFFVDHEDGEGLGNDVYLRGFDLDNGSGIEMKVGEVPINIPLHIHGQGYADVNFIIPEVVRSIRVLEGPYDPRQGDSAIVGSALFDLGVPERGYQLKATYGSFDQARIVGIAAPKEASDETFAAFSLRETQGFGAGPRVAVGLGQRAVRRRPERQRSPPRPGDRLRRERRASGRRAAGRRERRAHRLLRRVPVLQLVLPRELQLGVVLTSRRRGSRLRASSSAAELDHTTSGGAHFVDRAVGDVDQLPVAPELHGRPQQLEPPAPAREPGRSLAAHERRDRRRASRRASTPRPFTLGDFLEVVVEPGVSLRAGHTDQSKNLVNPADLDPWDYRENYGLDTLDLAGYLDLDVRLWKKLRISGGVRADFLDVVIDNNLAGVDAARPQRRAAGLGHERRRRRARAAGDRSVRARPGAHAGRLGGRGLSIARRGEPDAVQRPHDQADRRPELPAPSVLAGLALLAGDELRGGRSLRGRQGSLHDDAHGVPDGRGQRAGVRGGRGRAHDGEREHAARGRWARSWPGRPRGCSRRRRSPSRPRRSTRSSWGARTTCRTCPACCGAPT